jgi:hypothetical protein
MLSMSVHTQARSASEKPTFSLLLGKRAAVLRAPFAAWPFWAMLICGSTGLLSVVFGPDNYWDLRFYHLYAPLGVFARTLSVRRCSGAAAGLFQSNRWGNRPAFLLIAEVLGCCASG